MERNSQPANREDSPRPAKKISQFGLKELVPGINPDVDIVAIHEIDGDREDSWTAENGALWLRDFLPTIIPNARIITYGYDANTHGRATDFMHEHAMTFVSKLALFREETATVERPIIFVAYSFGGLLLKSALIHAHSCHENHLKYHHAVSQSTHGITFFGTPHQGSAIVELAQSLLDIRRFASTSNVLLQHLERNSEILQQQLVQYSAISGRFETKFFYEMYDTHVAGRMVPRTSAVVPGAVDADAIGVHKDHFDLVKFLSADDQDFRVVSTVLSLMSKTAQQKSIIKEVLLTPFEQSALSNLPHVDAARFDANSRPRCLEGTRVDLRKMICEWTEKDISKEHRQIFWLSGQAGTGKTTISLTAADDCENKGRLGASFFFSRDNAEQSNLQLVFPTLAQQLGIFHRPFQKSLAKVLERDLALVRMEPSRQFKKLIIEPLKSCDTFPPSTIIIIDALDECKDENPISKVLSILSAYIDELPCLKFFITSRPENHIIHGFRQLSISVQSVILHEIESSVVDADIERYLRAEFSAGSKLYPDLLVPGWPTDEAITSLVEKSGRLFIFAATAINFVFDRAYSHPPKQLTVLLSQSPATGSSASSPFTFLDRLYLQVLRHAFPKETITDRIVLLKMILGAIVLLSNPLSPGALENFLSLERGIVRTTLRHLHSVLVVPDTDQHFIRLIHPSFFDFTTSRCSDADFRIDSLVYHEQIGIACFKQMESLKRNICQIHDSSKLNIEMEDLAECIERHISPPMQYACLHWSFHLCMTNGDNLQGLLVEFCCRKILYWIEALSFLGCLRDGIRHLQDVSKFFKKFSSPPDDLLKVLRDTRWFMVQGFELLSCASLQLYRSALPLSAPSSFLSKNFHHELDGGMRVLQGEWMESSCGVTILRGSKGSNVTSVDFSPDGTFIVSASDNEVMLWDRGTGRLLQKLNAEPHSTVIWTKLFSDGSRVIAGTKRGAIWIWDVATGACLQTIRLGGIDWKETLRCYTFSRDFTRIIGSGYNLYIWRASNGDLLQTFSGHSDTTNPSTFSPNHMLIASAADDHTIRISNAINGTQIRTLRGHSKSVRAIAFSPDSKYIASGSRDNDIRLWNASSGVALKTLEGHTLAVWSVAFSPDGARVISGSLDKTLRVWDAISGELLQTLKCSGHVYYVGFSPDGEQYVSNVDCAIYIWDADRASNFNELKECWIRSIQFSTEGTYIIAHHSSRKLLNVWDGYTGNQWMSVDYHSIGLSPNGKYIASITNDRVLWLWDLASGTTLWGTQRGSKIDSFSFSSDSTRVVSTSFDHILRIWDVASGSNLLTIHSDSTGTGYFSRDGSQICTLACGSKHEYDIPPHARPHLINILPMNKPSEQLNYSMKNEWIFASNGVKEERADLDLVLRSISLNFLYVVFLACGSLNQAADIWFAERTQFGIKQLAPGINPDIDIVVIHGIDGDREDSWTAENGVLWLRDLLPMKIPNARIITYGYDANTYGQKQLATDFVHEHAMNLVSKLALLREETDTAERPIIFVAHSFGGLVLKSALIYSNSCHKNHLGHHRAISHSTYGVTFFGTPHQGSAIAKLARSILDIGRLVPTNNVLLQYLESSSEVLQQQLVHYSAISGQFETKFFYEMYDTYVVGRVVPRTSAGVPGAVNAEAIGIHKDHMNMIKFLSTDDEDFRAVSTVLFLMSKSAKQKRIIKEVVLTTSEQSALSNLPHVDDARFDADRRPHCLEGTRVDLRETIAEWVVQGGGISGENRRIFWLCGQAGTGKTTVSLTVADDCEIKGRLGASFFFSRDNADQSNFDLVFPTLAQQLGIFYRPFQKLLAKVLERDPAVVRMEPTRQFRKLLIEPLKSCDSFPTSTIVVIDALDECIDENPISRMLSILSAHINELPYLKFFITSRPENHVVHGFRQLSSSAQSVILHEIEGSVVDADIERYLRTEFLAGSKLYPDLLEPGWPTNEAILSLVEKSGRLFIFAATAIHFIFDPAYSHPPSQLTILLNQSPAISSSSLSPFAFLDRLYLQVLRRAFPQETTPDRLTHLKTILGAIVLLSKPLSPGALESLLCLECGIVRTTLRQLHSVLVVPDTDQQHIRLIHPSFFDFATSRCSDAHFRIDSLVYHEQLGISCFKQMESLKRNICQIQDESKLNSEIEDLPERIERYLPPAMQYACLHWSFHLCIAGGNNLQGLLREFCHRKILYWIEAVSLLGYLREGIRHLGDVSMFFNTLSTPPKGLIEILSDSTWFMSCGFEPISYTSLQLYRSVLPLSGPSSFLSKTFRHELGGGMRVLQGECMEYSCGVAALRGSKGKITSVDFSPDGTLIVSTSSDAITLWDRGTGGLLQKLNAEPNSCFIWARCFPDGDRVIAGTSWCTILIWNIATGACLQTIQLVGATMCIHLNCSTISPDFTRTVGSAVNDIYLWDTFKGDLLKTLSGHSNRVNSVAFSPNHLLMASASDDQTIRIWNPINGATLKTLRGHSGWVNTIAFSPDSNYIISGSFDNAIRLWDSNSGVALKTFKGHTLAVWSVSFSPDGAHVISGSLDQTLRVWDAFSGELLKTLECPERDDFGIKIVSVSPDGAHYVSTIGHTIYIWDPNRASNPKKSQEWGVYDVQFSTDRTYIFGRQASPDTLHVWDGYTGNYRMSVYNGRPCPNTNYIASISNDHILCLWNIASRTTLWKKQRISSFDFSSDGTRIVSTSFDCILRIWDVASGNNLFTLRLPPTLYSTTGVSFSRDGNHIITQDDILAIPPHVRPHAILPLPEPSEQLKHLMKNKWIFAYSRVKEERCVWIPYDWRQRPYASCHGRVAIASRDGLVLLDLSDIRLSL